MLTTFVAPPALRALLAKDRHTPDDAHRAVSDVVTETFPDAPPVSDIRR